MAPPGETSDILSNDLFCHSHNSGGIAWPEPSSMSTGLILFPLFILTQIIGLASLKMVQFIPTILFVLVIRFPHPGMIFSAAICDQSSEWSSMTPYENCAPISLLPLSYLSSLHRAMLLIQLLHLNLTLWGQDLGLICFIPRAQDCGRQ
jgi:hypothetical protein